MTREEAIERMKTMRWEHATNPCPDRTAFDMAISALKPTCKIDESNFSMEQYKADLQSAYDCGYNKASSENKGEFDGMNNGEVIQALFPNISKYNNMLLENHSRNILFDDKWWNASYQKGGE